MNFQDFRPTLLVGIGHVDLPIEPSQHGGIEGFGPIGGRNNNNGNVSFGATIGAVIRLQESIHFRQELIQRLVPLVVAVPDPTIGPRLCNGIQFVDEDDRCWWSKAIPVARAFVVFASASIARRTPRPQRQMIPALSESVLGVVSSQCGIAGFPKERSYSSRSSSHVHFTKVASAADTKCIAVGFSGNGLGNHGLSNTRAAVQQDAAWWLCPQGVKSGGILEVRNNLPNLGQNAVEARHVRKGCPFFSVRRVFVVVCGLGKELRREESLPVAAQGSVLHPLQHAIQKG
mmetsp:Transcript_94292/g.191939  ORF Transcript_94292/g.191939 Transcript_94292/m.191939 type:complete len:288 (-) Transcript_94292:79-942(-)